MTSYGCWCVVGAGPQLGWCLQWAPPSARTPSWARPTATRRRFCCFLPGRLVPRPGPGRLHQGQSALLPRCAQPGPRHPHRDDELARRPGAAGHRLPRHVERDQSGRAGQQPRGRHHGQQRVGRAGAPARAAHRGPASRHAAAAPVRAWGRGHLGSHHGAPAHAGLRACRQPQVAGAVRDPRGRRLRRPRPHAGRPARRAGVPAGRPARDRPRKWRGVRRGRRRVRTRARACGPGPGWQGGPGPARARGGPLRGGRRRAGGPGR